MTDSLSRSANFSRRQAIQAGSLGALGLALPGLLAADSSTRTTAAAARSCILFYMEGGPSHIDLWDMKPEAAAEFRGPFKPIRTKSPDIDISEILPLHAKVADKFSLVRSVHHGGAAVHDAGWQIMQTGRRFSGGIQTPHAGAVASHLPVSYTHLTLPTNREV